MGLGEGVGDFADDLGAAIFEKIDEERREARVVGCELQLRGAGRVVNAAHEQARGGAIIAGDEDDSDLTVIHDKLLFYKDEVVCADAGGGHGVVWRTQAKCGAGVDAEGDGLVVIRCDPETGQRAISGGSCMGEGCA